MRRLRVAVYHDLGPGGALRALDELLRRLSTDHDCDLFETVPALEARARAGMELGLEASCRDHHTFALADPPARGLKLGPAHILRQVWQLDRAEATVAEAIDAGGYDLAYVHPCHVRYTPAILRMLRTPVVFTMQEARRPSFEYRARRRRHESWRVGGNVMTRSVMTLAGEVGEAVVVRGDRRAARTPGVYVVCNSAFSAERILASYGIQAHVSYLGVDPERFRPSAGAPVSPTGGPFVVAVGRFVPSKRHDLVIEALARIPSRDRPAFVIVGEGPGTAYEDGLVSLAEGRGVDLRLRRSVDDDALVHLYRDAVATVCASELEPFGLTALESIVCGTPVVAVNEGGFRESVVDGVTGVLVDAGVHGLEDGITRVLADRTRFDPDALATSIRSGGWTWDDAAARVEARFASALGGG